MATLTIRGVDEQIRTRLRVRAAQHGRSMEAEVRALLDAALAMPPAAEQGLGSRIHARFAGERAGVEVPARTDRPRPAQL